MLQKLILEAIESLVTENDTMNWILALLKMKAFGRSSSLKTRMKNIPDNLSIILLALLPLQNIPGIQVSKYIDPPEDNVYLGAVLTFVVVVTGIFAYYQVLDVKYGKVLENRPLM